MTGSRTARRVTSAALGVVLATGVLAACSSTSTKKNNNAGGGTTAAGGASGSSGASGGGIKKGLKVYFIPKDTQNPYEGVADKGGQKAVGAHGASVVVSSGTADTAAAQLPSIQAAIQATADAIVIAANDPSALCPSLHPAAQAGIKIAALVSG